MSTFSCPVARVATVDNHPNADRLSILTLEGMGFTCISAKLEDGSPRYKVGDWVVYIPSDSVLPEWLLREMDFWDADAARGKLSGSQGNRVKPMRLRGVFSDGVLLSAERLCEHCHSISGDALTYWPGMDAAAHLGITKYEPPIPAAMAGEVAHISAASVNYDFERYESVPDIFHSGEHVTAVEKAHGTFCCIQFLPDLNHPEMFGSRRNITVSSKGLGKQGLMFKDNPANNHNLYVKNLRNLLDNGFDTQLQTVVNLVLKDIMVTEITTPLPVRIFGEIFGGSVQDLKYGMTSPVFRVFDVQVGYNFVSRKIAEHICLGLGLQMLPILYSGPFDMDAIVAVRDGKTVIGGDNVREGVVVTSHSPEHHHVYGRRICKFISPDYLLRKVKNGEPTEFT